MSLKEVWEVECWDTIELDMPTYEGVYACMKYHDGFNFICTMTHETFNT